MVGDVLGVRFRPGLRSLELVCRLRGSAGGCSARPERSAPEANLAVASSLQNQSALPLEAGLGHPARAVLAVLHAGDVPDGVQAGPTGQTHSGKRLSRVRTRDGGLPTSAWKQPPSPNGLKLVPAMPRRASASALCVRSTPGSATGRGERGLSVQSCYFRVSSFPQSKLRVSSVDGAWADPA